MKTFLSFFKKNNKHTQDEHRSLRGFSLIEMLVAVSLFTFVSLISVSTIVATNKLNQRLTHAKTIYDNLNLVLDDMSRSLRQGRNFRDDYSSALKNKSVIFIPNDSSTANPREDIYYLDDSGDVGVIYKGSVQVATTTTFPQDLNNNIIMDIQRLTSDEVDVDTFYIKVEGGCYASFPSNLLPLDGSACQGESDYRQPIVYVIIAGKTTVGDIPFRVETAINQRSQDR